MPARRLVRATATFACSIEGVERLVRAGDVLKASDPLVKGRPELFVAASAIEDTTAAPGETRNR